MPSQSRDLATAIARLEERVEALRREVDIELEERDKALTRLDRTTAEWKAQANEWRQTVNDVGRAAAEEGKSYVDQQIVALRDRTEQRAQASQRLTFAVLAAGATVVSLVTTVVGLVLRALTGQFPLTLPHHAAYDAGHGRHLPLAADRIRLARRRRGRLDRCPAGRRAVVPRH